MNYHSPSIPPPSPFPSPFSPSHLLPRLRWSHTSLTIRCVMSVVGCIAVGAMLPTSVATSTAFATTVSTAGQLSTQLQARRTTAASSRRTGTAPELSTSFPLSPASPYPNWQELRHHCMVAVLFNTYLSQYPMWTCWPKTPWPPCKESSIFS